MPPSPRRTQIEAMLTKSPDDTFLLYGLAMEVLKEGDEEGAIGRLKGVTEKDPNYQAAFQQLGQLFANRGQISEAKQWLERGVAAARRSGNAHAAEEMQGFMMSL